MRVLFDMETGDPDDLITLLMLLLNPKVDLAGVTCYEGSPVQIGLIEHVLALANRKIPVGGWNAQEPAELNAFYSSVVGSWAPAQASLTPVDVFADVCTPETTVLTGAPLTNVAFALERLSKLHITNMVTQGGFLGHLTRDPLPKFVGKSQIRTYNLSSDPLAFDVVNHSERTSRVTYVTKDVCHGFVYSQKIHDRIQWSASPLSNLLRQCFEHYVKAGKTKAMHDPLAMLYMLNTSMGEVIPIEMDYTTDVKGHALFSSRPGKRSRYGLIAYDKVKAWDAFVNICCL